MANALSPSISSPHLGAPHPSQDISLQHIPDVFVIPPEEEQDINPPFQYFDASQAALAATSPDFDALDVALGLFQQADGNRAPVFHRHHTNESQDTIIMPRRSLSRQSILADSDVVEDDIMRSHSDNRRGFDEDVVEVIKVRRNEGMSDVSDGKQTMMRKSKTFRARASQALRSIKNVAKTNRKPVSDIWPAAGKDENIDHTQQDVSDRHPIPNLTRRKSATLSQLFGTVRSSSRSSMNTPDPVVIKPSLSHESALPTPRRASTSLGDRTNTQTTLENNEEDDRSKPVLSKRKSFRNRISVLDLQRLFTPSTSGVVSSEERMETVRPSSRASKRESIPLSLSSRLSSNHSDPQVIQDVFGTPVSRPHQRSSLALSKSSSNNSSALRREFDEDVILETSFEMRLDSLQFDSLHFDPEEYEL
ncbi:hypothetical protein QCA50_002753 [Cerrena zonata]|uniref:Uncharacterized protein n=1 Tax=Cerrena zonata TaxID=2478898 RepID=A0AAW0GKK1_9APHY